VPFPTTQLPVQDEVALRSTTDLGVERHIVALDTWRPIDAPTLLRFWHLVSLDAPSVALAWSLSFAWVAHVRLPLWVPALLTLAVWAVYVGDRLFDARRSLQAGDIQNLQERHLFHWRHRRVLAPLAVAAASGAAFIIFNFMPVSARERDSLLAAASLVYFTRVHTGRKPSLLLSKEFLVGMLFTAGCALPALSRAALPHSAMPLPLLIPVVVFALLAWLNCHAIDRWETSSDCTSRLSISFRAGLLAVTSGVLSAALCASQPRSSALLACAAISAFLLSQLDRFRNRLTPVALRAIADLVLLTPLLLIPFVAMFHR
jgi:hypothetical protein